MVLTESDRFVPLKGVEFRAVEEGGMLVDLDTGYCFRLNRVGAEVWDLLSRGNSVADVIGELGGAYQVPEERLRGDVGALCRALVGARLVAIAPRADEEAP